MNSAGYNHKLLVSDVKDRIGAGDSQDGDVIPGQGLAEDLLLDVLGTLRVSHDLLDVQHHV